MKPNIIFKFFSSSIVMAVLAHVSYGQTNPEQSVAPASVIIELLALNRDIATPERPKYLSPTALVASPDSQYLYVAEQTAKQIGVFDLKTNWVTKIIKLPSEVTGLAVAPDGTKLYATCFSDRWPSGMVCEVSVATGKVTRRLPAGHGARAPVISHDGKTLYVCNQFDNDVYADDIASGQVVKKIPVLREPYAAAITPNDSLLIVTQVVSDQLATDSVNKRCKIMLIDAVAKNLRDTLFLPLGSASVFGVTISPDGNYAFATHLINYFLMPATKTDNGWIRTNNCAIVDIKNRKILNDVTLDEPMQGSANPWGIGCSRDGKILCVTHAGSNELSVIDVQKLITLADTTKYYWDYPSIPEGQTQLWHNLIAMNNFMSKVKVSGKGPRALAIIGNRAYTAGYFSDTLESFDLMLNGGTKEAGAIALGAAQPLTAERKGELAFCDANLCYQKWASCQSCHPFARADGLNWVLRNEFAAPKNTKSLVYSWWTPPTNWAGYRQNAYESVRAGMINELFLEPDMDVAASMDTFLMKLKPTPSPYLVKGNLSESGTKGKQIFMTNPALDCKKCHAGPLFTDMKPHNAGVQDPYDNMISWDTPSLIESWRSAPYSHLGSFNQLSDIMKFKGMSNAGSSLSQQEFDDLVEFISSL
jgi:YVTN family beta-propeller protein